MQECSFSKYSGCGNDFILFDNLAGHFPTQDSNLIRRLCHRKHGIGADGVILLERSSSADFGMRIFNSDGTEAEMCGNGLRCIMKFIESLGFDKQEFTIQTMHRKLRVKKHSDLVETYLGAPKDIRWNQRVNVEGKEFSLDSLDSGVPHVVLFVDNVESINVNRLGPLFRYHQAFAPRGTNVNFVQVVGPDRIRIRTYERGVEEETLACGTGAAAAAIAAAEKFQLPLPVKVTFESGDTIEVDYKGSGRMIEEVIQRGPARKLFHGVVTL